MRKRKFFRTAMAVSGASAFALAYSTDTLDPLLIPKFVDPMVVPPAMPLTGQAKTKGGANADYYEIAVRQFEQRILPARDVHNQPLGATTVWSYGSVNHPFTFNYPAFTIEARSGRPVRVKWINQLVDMVTGNYLPHLLTVDPTLHWANPPGGEQGRDKRPFFTLTPDPYRGPVPIVTHVHGAETYDDSDGYAEAWFLPNARDIPAGYARVGSRYDAFRRQAEARSGASWEPGTAVFDYPNDQPAATLWYHDHTLGMTRLNVYAGPAGFYLVRGGAYDLHGNQLPSGAFEIPIAIQDRTFQPNGQLRYPESRVEFDGVAGLYLPDTDVSPYWNPEFFGNTIVVNGKTWPFLNVEQRRYRFRPLNGCNSRFLILKFRNPNIKVWQIGAEGGFLKEPVLMEEIVMSPAERADVIVDFSNVRVGTDVLLRNLGPDEPFSGGIPGLNFDPADPQTTGQVMQFRVIPRKGNDKSLDPTKLKLPQAKPLPRPKNVRQLTLTEMMSDFFMDAPVMAMLGTLVEGMPRPYEWGAPITENPFMGDTEEWELYNLTGDAHPIHLHQLQFQVVDRQDLELDENGEPELPVELEGKPIPPPPTESGFKDTVIAYPGQVTRIRARFKLPGLFVWHCHIVEHEDNEMMRPLIVRRR